MTTLGGFLRTVPFDERTLAAGRHAGLYEQAAVWLEDLGHEGNPMPRLCFEIQGLHWSQVIEAAASYYNRCVSNRVDWFSEKKQQRVLAEALLRKRQLLERGAFVFTEKDLWDSHGTMASHVELYPVLLALEAQALIEIQTLQVHVVRNYSFDGSRPYFEVGVKLQGVLAKGEHPFEVPPEFEDKILTKASSPFLHDSGPADGEVLLHINSKWSVPFRKNYNPYELLRLLFVNEGTKRKALEFGDVAWELDRMERPDKAVLKKWGNAAYNANRRIAERTRITDFLLLTSRTVRINPKYLPAGKAGLSDPKGS